MQTVISLSASSISQEELAQVLSDYLALDRARIIRRLLVARFGFVAMLAVLLDMFFRGFSPVTRLFTITLCVFPPLWARIVELCRRRRLSRRIEATHGAATHTVLPRSAGRPSVGIRKS